VAFGNETPMYRSLGLQHSITVYGHQHVHMMMALDRRLTADSADNMQSCIESCSSVGIVTGYGVDDRTVGIRVPAGLRIFSSLYRPDRLWGVSNGYGGAYAPRVDRPGH
jgi:hypothetical protein